MHVLGFPPQVSSLSTALMQPEKRGPPQLLERGSDDDDRGFEVTLPICDELYDDTSHSNALMEYNLQYNEGETRMNGSCAPEVVAGTYCVVTRLWPSDWSERSKCPEKQMPRGTKRPREASYEQCRATNNAVPRWYYEFANQCAEVHTRADSSDSSVDYEQMTCGCDFEEGLAHCEAAIMNRWQRCGGQFYIGITGDPEFRWKNSVFGHKLKYRLPHRPGNMRVLLKASLDITRAIEISLVKNFHKHPQLRDNVINVENTPIGPVSATEDGRCFLYVIWY